MVVRDASQTQMYWIFWKGLLGTPGRLSQKSAVLGTAKILRRYIPPTGVGRNFYVQFLYI